jgi:hypothetical protein
MKSISQVTIAVAVIAGLTLGAAATGVAQGKSQTPRARHTSVARPSNPSGAAKNKSESFPRGVATKLGTTPEAMETAYATAKQADPKLTRGHFIAANMIAKNLGAKNPAITTQALLSGLQSGKSIGQTLESLGVSSVESHEAQRAAAREAKEAEQAQDNAAKPKP